MVERGGWVGGILNGGESVYICMECCIEGGLEGED